MHSRTPRIHVRVSKELCGQIDGLAAAEKCTRTEATLRLIRAGLESRTGEVQSTHEYVERLNERLDLLESQITSEQSAIATAMASGLNDVYNKLFVMLENCFVIDVELLLLLRLSLAKRDPATAIEAREKARDFLQKKYLQFGLTPPKNAAAEPVT